MKPPPIVAFAVFACLLGQVRAQDSPSAIEQALESKFRDKVLTLRGFYRSESLHFDRDMGLITGGDASFGPSDGEIHAAAFHVSGDQLTIEGDLPVMFYDATTGRAIYKEGRVKREVVLEFSEPLDPAKAEQALWKVFYRPGERPLPPCSAAMAESFRLSALETVDEQAADSDSTAAVIKIVERSSCFPNGEVAPHIGMQGKSKFQLPHATYNPNPRYTRIARDSAVEGTVVLRIIVDKFGRVSSPVVLRSLGYGLDESAAETVHNWRFDPATLDAEPIAVAVNVEIKFALRPR